MASNTFDIKLVVFKNYDNNNQTSIASYGRYFRGIGGRSDHCSINAFGHFSRLSHFQPAGGGKRL